MLYKGSYEVEAGLPIVASLTGVSYPTVDGTYAWKFASNDSNFAYYDPTHTNNDQLIPLHAPDSYNQSGFSFYTKKAQTLTVTGSVNVTGPDGKVFTVTATQPLISVVPKVTWRVGVPYGGAVEGVYNDSDNSGFGAVELWGPVTVTEPYPFGGLYSGTFCIVQIGTFSRSISRPQEDGVSYTKVNAEDAYGTTGPYLKPQGLDGAFPYNHGHQKRADGTFTDDSGSASWGVGIDGYSGDKPQQPYFLYLPNQTNSWNSSIASDSFQTWVMYKPAYGNGMWIPLQQLTWKWGGTATLNTDTFKWDAVQMPTFDRGTPANTSEFPTWNLRMPSISLSP